jgi:signal transduction histidine kinase/ActR/RegA family two-component response regulator
VDSASNGVDALHLAERNAYDLVISDILMPRMDGFQLCREFRKHPILKKTPLIFYTATYTDPKDEEFALSLGANRFLIKPIEPDLLIKTIEETVHSGRKPTEGLAEIPTEDESIYLKEYNARLVAKLEKKMLDLEQANRALEADIARREQAEAQRAKLERQLRQSQKMEAIGTLAGGIAHDFNNILAGIMGFSELLKQDAAHPELVREHVTEITRAAERARELVRQILTFSRQQEQARHPIKLHQCVEEVLRLLRATIPSTIQIEAALDAAAPTVLADATQLHQIVANLLTNAWHAIGDRSGRIGVRLMPFFVDHDFACTNPDLRPGRYVRLTITDTGCGMDPQTLERIFDPFFTTKEPGSGYGLGLAVVHGIMKANDGAIIVYSELGRGTEFHLFFPAIEIEASPAPVRPAVSAGGNGERILFIDDEPVLTVLGERFLKRLGYEPVVEGNPVKAIERFRNEKFDLVVTDLTMPHLNGLDVGRELLAIRPGLPIVLTTGYSATLDIERARVLGFSALLIKPYNIEALGEAINQAFSGRPVASA